jgi:acetylglutamate kinase
MSEIRTPWVLKAGGRELIPGRGLERLAKNISKAVQAGRPTVLVHGGGEEVSARAEALGLPTVRVAGQRVTDAATLNVVIEVLAGAINLRLVRALQHAGVDALGLTGADGGLLKVTPAGHPPGSLGLVGTPTETRPDLLRRLIGIGVTPVVAPLGVDTDGTLYNVNADLAAAALAGALQADLTFLTDVPGVLDAHGTVLPTLDRRAVRRLLETGGVTGGMIPKLEAAEAALALGVRSLWIGDLDGLEALPSSGRGTRLAGGPEAAGTSLPLRRVGGVPT